MKKLLFLFLTLFITTADMAQTQINGIYYNLDSSARTAEVTSGSPKYSGSISIPSSVTYNGITYSVTSIGFGVFSGCSGLTSVTIPSSVTNILNQAFVGCTSLTSIDIPNSVTIIGGEAFEGCTGLTSVTIPSSVTSIGSFAFSECTSLTSIDIPNSVTSIGRNAFTFCTSLTSITIPSSLTDIGSGPFLGCSGLTSITVDPGNTVYDSRNNCNAIIKTSTNQLFAGCKNTIIPSSVTSIGTGAFHHNTELTSITIPSSVTSIGSSAFNGCTGLTSVTIPSSVTSIGISAFEGCTGLTSVTIPSSVTSMGDHTFYGCTGLSSFFVDNPTPPTTGYLIINKLYNRAILYVPTGSLSAYQNATNWKDFSDIRELDRQEQSLSYSGIPAKTYGDAAFTLPVTTTEGQTITWASSNTNIATISGNTLTIKDAGSATITATQAGNINYKPFTQDFTLTVAKAPLTITAKSYTITRGDALPTFEATYSGFKNNETSSVLTTQPTFSCSATSNSTPGTYTITPSGAVAANYEITYINGTLTINGNQTVNLTQIPAQTYGATTYSLPEKTNADLTITWSSSNTNVAIVNGHTLTIKNAGTAIITATQAGNSNYNAFTQDFTLTVNKAPLTVTAKSFIILQGDAIPAFEAEYAGFVNNETANVLTTQPSFSCSATSNSAPGAYTITPSGAAAANYEISYINGTLTILSLDGLPDTDYSQMDNTLYIERTEAGAGSQVQLSIKMKNTVAVQGYQFDLYLPEGVTVATDGEGFPMAELSLERTTARKTDYFNSSIQPDGHLIVMSGSTKGYTFDGNDGEVALVTLDVADDMEEGEYAIIMRNVVLTDPNATSYDTDFLKSTLEVFTYILGDVNADTKINVADFIAVANHILGNTPPVFVYKAADVNLDTKINVADFIGIANMILSGTTSANKGSMMLAPRRADSVTPTNIDNLNNAIYIDPVTVVPGTQQVLSVKMKNAAEVAGFEFNLQLPEGISIAQEDGFDLVELSTERTTARKTNYFDYGMQNDGTLKVLCGTSAKNPETGMLYTFEGNDGEVARITIDIPNDYEGGEYAIHVLNGILADINSEEIDLETDIISQLTVEAGDGRIHFSETDTSLPAYTAGERGDITMARTINAGEWSTIVLPFNLTRANATKVFGTDVQFAEFTGFEVDYGDDEENVTPLGITLFFSSYTIPARGNLAGGTPVLIKTGKNISEIKLDAVTLARTVTNVETTDGYGYNIPGKFIGTFVKTKVPEDGLFISGGKFWYSTGKTDIKGFRGWFELGAVLDKETDFGANINFVVDDEPTSVDGIPAVVTRAKGDVYTIHGLYMGRDINLKRLPSGIYIIDGKKMVIK